MPWIFLLSWIQGWCWQCTSHGELLKRRARYLDIGFAAAFRILGGMRSGPEAIFSCRFDNSFSIPSSAIVISCISGNSSSSGSGMSLRSSWLNTDWYWRLRIPALLLASDTSRPFSFRGAVPVLSFFCDFMWLQNFFWVWPKFSSFGSRMLFSMWFQYAFLMTDWTCFFWFLKLSQSLLLFDVFALE